MQCNVQRVIPSCRQHPALFSRMSIFNHWVNSTAGYTHQIGRGNGWISLRLIANASLPFFCASLFLRQSKCKEFLNSTAYVTVVRETSLTTRNFCVCLSCVILVCSIQMVISYPKRPSSSLDCGFQGTHSTDACVGPLQSRVGPDIAGDEGNTDNFILGPPTFKLNDRETRLGNIASAP